MKWRTIVPCKGRRPQTRAAYGGVHAGVAARWVHAKKRSEGVSRMLIGRAAISSRRRLTKSGAPPQPALPLVPLALSSRDPSVVALSDSPKPHLLRNGDLGMRAFLFASGRACTRPTGHPHRCSLLTPGPRLRRSKCDDEDAADTRRPWLAAV